MNRYAQPPLAPARRRTRRLALFAVGLVSSALVAGCASGSSGSGGDAGSSGSGGDAVQVRVIEANQHDPTILGAEAGNHLDIWSQCSPKVTVKVTAGQKVGEAVAAGSADIGIASPNRVIGAIGQGLEATIIGASMPVWDQFLIVGAGSKASSFADLKGATFGVTTFGSAGHYATVKSAKDLGWSKDDYKVVTLGSLEGLGAGLKKGTIEGFLFSATSAFSLEKAGTARVLENVRDIVGPNALNVLFVSNDFRNNHPKELQAFADCYYKAVAEIVGDRKKAEELLIGEWKMDPTVADKVITDELPLLSKDGKLDDDQLRGMLEATHFTIDGSENITFDDVKKMYTYWKDL